MPEWNADVRSLGPALFAPFAICMALAACSSGSESTTSFLVAPGKYQYHNCEQLAGAAKATSARQQELKGLIEKAERGAAGALVGTIAYKSDYLTSIDELRLIEATAREKQCLTSETWRSNSIIQ